MKILSAIFIIICSATSNLGSYNSSASLDLSNTLKNSNEQLGICIFLESSFGPELDFIKKGSTGAIFEEFIKAIEQNIIIIASSVLIAYLKLLIDKKTSLYNKTLEQLKKYLFLQTKQNNFCLFIPEMLKNNSLASLGFSDDLKTTGLENFTSSPSYKIELDELKTIFIDSKQVPKKLIYCTGHGIPGTWNTEPLIAGLTLNQYKDFILFLNQLNCRFLFISSCYAAGINMIDAHTKLSHVFPIAIGNLTDNASSFYPKINFKKYFEILVKVYRSIRENEIWHSADFKKAIKKICGSNINNTPWLKLPKSEKFFLLNLNNNLVINDKDNSGSQPTIEIDNVENLLISSINVQNKLHIKGPNLPKIISVIPGQSYHIFEYVKAPNQSLYEFINNVFSVPYEFRKVFLFKKIKIKKAKRKPQKFKVIKMKNVLAINYGIDELDSIFRNHELYFQKETDYYRIQIPSGLKLGYLEIEPERLGLANKKNIIDQFLQLSKPADQILKLIEQL